MRTKVLTINCASCHLCEIDDNSRFLCKWGNGEPKNMESPKGKKPIRCKLKR